MHISSKKVGVKNGGACNVKYVTKTPFPQLSNKAAEADTFDEFLTSLMSVYKTANNGNVLIFTKEGVTVYKEKDVLITCQGKPILIRKRDERGQYFRPTKPKRTTLEMPNTSTLQGKKVHNVYSNVYEVRNTVLSYQIGQFPTRSQ